jgi:hypothetical protein
MACATGLGSMRTTIVGALTAVFCCAALADAPGYAIQGTLQNDQIESMVSPEGISIRQFEGAGRKPLQTFIYHQSDGKVFVVDEVRRKMAATRSQRICCKHPPRNGSSGSPRRCRGCPRRSAPSY